MRLKNYEGVVQGYRHETDSSLESKYLRLSLDHEMVPTPTLGIVKEPSVVVSITFVVEALEVFDVTSRYMES